jgi:hypothetical protein
MHLRVPGFFFIAEQLIVLREELHLVEFLISIASLQMRSACTWFKFHVNVVALCFTWSWNMSSLCYELCIPAWTATCELLVLLSALWVATCFESERLCKYEPKLKLQPKGVKKNRWRQKLCYHNTSHGNVLLFAELRFDSSRRPQGRSSICHRVREWTTLVRIAISDAFATNGREPEKCCCRKMSVFFVCNVSSAACSRFLCDLST